MSLNLSSPSGLTCNFANFALAGLGGATTHSHTASVPIVIKGRWATSPSGTTTPTTNSAPTHVSSVLGALPAGSALSVTAPAAGFKAALVVWTCDAAGTKKIRSNGFFASAGGAPLDLEFPAIPDDECVLSYHTLKAISTLSGTWTYGSNNFTGVTGMTTGTVVNVCGAPGVAGAVTVS